MSRWFTCMFFGTLAAFGMNVTVVHGTPGPADLKASDSGLLKRAVAVDLGFVGPEKASQSEAERLYLQFINENAESPLVPYIYYRLAHMYSGKVDSSWEAKFGHKKDRVKAREYFLKAVEAHPPMLSSLLVRSRVSATALAPTKEKIVEEYIEFYKWLSEMKKEEIAERLWLRETTKRAITRRPSRIEESVNAFWELRLAMQDVAKGNMLAVAKGAEKPIELLDRISDAFPDDELGDEARALKNDLLRRNPLMATDPAGGLGRVASAWAVGLGVPCAVVAFFVYRSRRRGALAACHGRAK